MMRLLGVDRSAVLLVGLAVAPLVVGCNADADGAGADTAPVDAVEQQAVSAIDGVLHDVAGAVQMEFVSGTRSFAICGESYAPRGVVHRAFLQFQPSGLEDDAAVEAAATAMAGDGWQVERPANPAVVVGEKAATTLQLEFGAAAVAVSVRSSCAETSDDVARDYADRAGADVEWE